MTHTTPYLTVRDPDQVREVLRRVDDFAPHNALVSVTPLSPEALRILSRVGFALPDVLASATGEAHRRVRSLVTAYFSPTKVARIEPRVRHLTDARCETVRARLDDGPVDLVRELSRHIPPVIMQDLIGSGCPDLDLLNRWSRDSLELFWGWPDPERQLELAHSAAELYAWLRKDVRAHCDDSSLFGTLHQNGLGEREICSLGYFLLIAGQETTAQLITTSLYRTLQHPNVWQRLADGAPATGIVRRILATESSVPTWRRIAAHGTTLGDAHVAAGTEILLELTGNHPAEARDTAYGLAFGYGPHRCLGARLAEVEVVAVLEQTARALPGLRLSGPEPAWLRLLSFQSPLTLTVRSGE
ncbi:hypothetical protein N802_06145 [Knoellia sinensis KCTC 19936]|uniref:Cytochrome P450 n=1 Tax=Knoellia sinensis KCTC 19936 TaxID=1385520 RepID=A0A0A0J594_9MICO|nr:cytochrome P450 [Knoellia sinensis]KGN30786.1 hypothetical protein N802_06145 [Knoellia sinensis KCTC 19936]